MGRRTRRRGNGRRTHRPARAPLSYRQHLRQQRPDKGSPEHAAIRLGTAPQEGRGVNAVQSESRNGASRPPWITGLAPPNSWRPLRQPGYPQLHRVQRPQHRAWGDDLKLKVRNFRFRKVRDFRLGLTVEAARLPRAVPGLDFSPSMFQVPIWLKRRSHRARSGRCSSSTPIPTR